MLESFSHLILEKFGLLFFILKKLSLAEENNHAINMIAQQDQQDSLFSLT